MNYTDSDVQAIVDTQVELKTRELKQENKKLEDKYLTEHNILTEFEKWLNEEAPCYFDCNYPVIRTVDICNKLEELKGDKNGKD